MKLENIIFNYQCLSLKDKSGYENAAEQISLFSRQMDRDEWMLHDKYTCKKFIKAVLSMYALFNEEGSLLSIITADEITDLDFSAMVFLPWRGTGRELFEAVRDELELTYLSEEETKCQINKLSLQQYR